MRARVLQLGCGDVGLKIADGLLRQGGIEQLVLADLGRERAESSIAMLNDCHPSLVSFAEIDALDPLALERLLRQVRPDLIVQAASLISPWSIIGRDHPTARALGDAGIAIQLPMQLPIVVNLMQVLAELGWSVPVANLSMPDIIHPVLDTGGLAPTIGLGNVSILLLRSMAAWKARAQSALVESGPLIRAIGHHSQVYDVMRAEMPGNEADRVRVYVGEDGEREDDLAYIGRALAPGRIYNVITAASVLPVLAALLPGAAGCRFSAPAPFGLPGGYPVRIEEQAVSLDLPDPVSLEEAVEYNCRLARRDGLQAIDADGVVSFTEAAREAVQAIDPTLAEPLDWRHPGDRAERLRRVVDDMGPLS
jgi:hypothetical protein